MNDGEDRPTLSFTDVCVDIQNKRVLRNVTGRAEKGEILAVMGPSGKEGPRTTPQPRALVMRNSKVSQSVTVSRIYRRVTGLVHASNMASRWQD